MAIDLEHDDLGPGLHVFREPAPLDRAGALAARLQADLCSTMPQADAILAERQALAAVGDDTLDALRVLASRVAVADRIAQRTRDRAAAEVAERMAGVGSGMAVHPTTIRERADAVVRARTEVAQADQLLEAHDTIVPAPDKLVEAPVEHAPVPAAPGPPRKRGLFGFLRRAKDDGPDEDMAASTAMLRSVATATDEAFGARRAEAVRADQRTLLVVRRDSAVELVRVAERAWRDLAGEDVDPADVEEVVRRLDPQHQDALVVAQETIAVRAASTVFDNAVARWDASWADLGLEPPVPGEAVEAVDRMAERRTKAVVLVGDATERGLDLAEAAPTAPVIVIEGLLDDGA